MGGGGGNPLHNVYVVGFIYVKDPHLSVKIKTFILFAVGFRLSLTKNKISYNKDVIFMLIMCP